MSENGDIMRAYIRLVFKVYVSIPRKRVDRDAGALVRDLERRPFGLGEFRVLHREASCRRTTRCV